MRQAGKLLAPMSHVSLLEPLFETNSPVLDLQRVNSTFGFAVLR